MTTGYFTNLIAHHYNETDPQYTAVEQLTMEIREFVHQQGWKETIERMVIERYGQIIKQNNYSKVAEVCLPPKDTNTAVTEEHSPPKATDTTPAKIYTDGSCLGNPGPGGWCAILNAPGKPELIVRGNKLDATNNQMEMKAVIGGLAKAGDHRDVTIYTDSRYVVDAFNKGWLDKWQTNGWRTNKGLVLNRELWEQMVQLAKGNGTRKCIFVWVRGHAGNQMNERADQIAVEEAHKIR